MSFPPRGAATLSIAAGHPSTSSRRCYTYDPHSSAAKKILRRRAAPCCISVDRRAPVHLSRAGVRECHDIRARLWRNAFKTPEKAAQKIRRKSGLP